MTTQPSTLRPRLILPVMILTAILTLGVRVGSVVESIQTGAALDVKPIAPVMAAADPAPAAKEGTPPAAAKDGASADASEDGAAAEDMAGGDDDSDEELSGTQMSIMRDLGARRAELDKRGKQLDAREALIRIAEQRVDQKVKEMEALKAQVQTLLGQANAAQAAQIENLVKIYETMKPKEAARIFDTLDMPVLMGVIQKMKPQKTAAVLAEMASEKAKEVTVALTRQDQLPQMKNAP